MLSRYPGWFALLLMVLAIVAGIAVATFLTAS